MKKLLLTLATLGAVAGSTVAVASCGKKKTNEVGMAIKTDREPNDGGFLQQAYEAVKAVYGGEPSFHVAPKQDAIGGAVAADSAIKNGSKVFVGAGFQYAFLDSDKYAGAHKDMQFVAVDAHGKKGNKNFHGVTFEMGNAAVVAGYLVAKYASSHADVNGDGKKTIGMYGGQPFGSVTSFMIGFQKGVNAWNTANSANKVELISKSKTDISDHVADSGLKAQTNDDYFFTKTFLAGKPVGRAVASRLAHDADYILPVAGAGVKDVIAAVKAEAHMPSAKRIIGVDADQSKTMGTDGKLFLTSILKNVKQGVMDTLKAIKEKKTASSDKTDWTGVVADSFVQADIDAAKTALTTATTNSPKLMEVAQWNELYIVKAGTDLAKA